MSQGLLDRLREAGELDSVGEFTLDAERARLKMARFGLTEPGRYILELIAAAVALGTPHIELDTRAGVELRFQGQPLPARGLQDLDCYLFGAGQDPTERALSYLAMGLNAASQLGPRRISVETPEGLRLLREKAEVSYHRGSYSQHRVEILHQPDRTLSEAGLIKAECRYAPCPIILNGEELKYKSQPLWMEVDEATQERRLRIGLSQDLTTRRLSLVSHGVVVGRKEPDLELPLEGLVWDDQLRRNASHSDVVEDDGYQLLLDHVNRIGRAALGRLCEEFSSLSGQDRSRVQEFLLARIPLHKKSTPLAKRLATVPLLPTLGGSEVSFEDLHEQLKTIDEVPVSQRKVRVAPGGPRVVYLTSELERKALDFTFGSRVKNVESRLLKELEAQDNRGRWQARSRPAKLPPGSWLARRPLDTAEYRGEIGLDPHDTDAGSVLHLLYQGKLLSTVDIDGPLSYVAVLDFPELNILSDWSGPVQDKRYRKALANLEREAEHLYDSLDLELLEDQQPGLREHLLLRMHTQVATRQPLSRQLRTARIFPELRGGLLSLDGLEQQILGRTPLGYLPPGTPALPEGLPESALPQEPVVLAGPEEQKILRHHLGKSRLSSFTKRYEALQKLAGRLKNREKPVVEDLPWSRVAISTEEARGELALDLFADPGIGVVRVLLQGVLLDTQPIQTSGPAYRAAVDCSSLTPSQDWKSFHKDEAWTRVCGILAKAAREAWTQLVTSAGSRPEEPERKVLLRLAAREPELHPRLTELELFPGLGGVFSADRIRQEWTERGQVLMAQDPDTAPPEGQAILLAPGEEEVRALEALLPSIELTEAEPILARARAEEEFLAQPVRRELAVGGQVLEREELPAPLLGQVALTWEAGTIEFFLRGRRLCLQKDALPVCLAAVVESPHFEPDPLYRRVASGLEAAEQGIRQAAGRIACRFASRSQFRPGHMELILNLLIWRELDDEAREALEAAPCIPQLPQGRISLREVRARLGKRKKIPFVPGGITGRPLQTPVVLVLPSQTTDLVERLLGKKLANYADQLVRDEVQRRLLTGYASNLPDCLVRLKLETPEADLTGEVGIPRDAGQRGLVFLRAGELIGHLDAGEVVAAARLEGAFRLNRRAEVLLKKRQRQAIKRCLGKAYAELAERYNRLPGKDQSLARGRLLEFLLVHRKHLGGDGPTAELNAALMTLPLVETTAGERVSVQSLIEETQSQGELVYAARNFQLVKPDGLLPVLPPDSAEHELCLHLVGKQLLTEWRPQLFPKIDAVAVGRRLGSAWAWGVSGIKTVGGWFGAAGDTLSAAGARVVEAVPELPKWELKWPHPSESPEPAEEELLRAIRREFQILVRGRAAGLSRQVLDNLAVARWALGPPILWREDQLLLNRLHPTIRYCRDHLEADRACLVILVTHILCLINARMAQITDQDELHFLGSLAETMRGAFPTE